MKELSGFMCYKTYLETGKRLNDNQFRKFIEGLMNYSTDMTEPDFNDDPLLATCFDACKGSLKASRDRYYEKIKYTYRNFNPREEFDK